MNLEPTALSRPAARVAMPVVGGRPAFGRPVFDKSTRIAAASFRRPAAPVATWRPAPGLVLPESVRRVIANPDPVVRNLQITQSYHELTVALDPFFGGADALWTGFATWASKQAGSFIRGDQATSLQRFLARYRAGSGCPFAQAFGRGEVLAYLEATVEEVSRHVAEGNHLVYAKLAPLYADFLVLAETGLAEEWWHRERFLKDIAADPTTGDALVRAFRYYFEALTERDEKRRSELVYLANLLVGWHEQVRLQGPIDGALTAPIRLALERLRRRRGLSRGLALVAERVFTRFFEKEWKRLATQGLMSLALPSVRLELGDDVPVLADGRMFPAVLAEIEHEEARAVLAEIGATPDSTRGSGADDWSDLGDRMSYVADFFRSRQRDRALLFKPYDAAQVTDIRAGRLASGRL